MPTDNTALNDTFLKRYPLVRFNKGDILLRPGEINHYLYYIKSGVCACSIIHLDGNLIIPLFLRKDELIGARMELLGVKENRSLSEVSAHTDVEVYKIPIRDIRALLQTDFEAYKRLARSVILSLDRVIETSNMRGKGNSVMIVCNTLLHEMSSEGCPEGLYRLSDYFTITDLSRILQLHRVTVSRIMHGLVEKNVLEKRGRVWYITDRKKLEKYQQGILTLNPKAIS